jgi:predicted dehydrogenase
MAEKVRIGFVGVGGMGQAAHLANYVSCKECQVVAVAEIKPRLGAAVARRYDIPKVYTSHQEMLEKEQLDGVVASQPFTRHGLLLPEIFKFGLPVFSEKPLAGSIEQSEKILKALAAGGGWHMVGYHKRSDPATEYAKAEIDKLKASGEIGRMKYVRVVMPAGDWMANGFYQNVNTDEPVPALEFDPPASDMDKPTFDKYISFVNYYIHQVNLMRHLLGESYRPVFADKPGVLLVGESASGITCTIEMSPFMTTVDWEESALVCFERGWIKIELPAPLTINRAGRVTVFKDPGNGATPMTTTPTMPWLSAMQNQARNFIRAIRGERKPPCEAAEAMEDLKVARQYLRLFLGR